MHVALEEKLNVTPLWPNCINRIVNGFGSNNERAFMYVTTINFTSSPFSESSEPDAFTLIDITKMNLKGVEDIRRVIAFLADRYETTFDWDSWQHDEQTHQGSIRFIKAQEATMSWSYSALDDPDLAEVVDIPVDHHAHAVGVLTPEQVNEFWGRVSPEINPIDIIDDILRQFGMTPAFHDEADHGVMRYVVALEWWRVFPSVAAGEATLRLEPDLTADVFARVTAMAARCYLERERFDLYEVFVS
jgi:hypothetical protein